MSQVIHHLHEVLVTDVVFLNIAGKVQSIEAPPTNEDDSITHLNAKVLNRAEKVLKRHFCHQLFSKSSLHLVSHHLTPRLAAIGSPYDVREIIKQNLNVWLFI